MKRKLKTLAICLFLIQQTFVWGQDEVFDEICNPRTEVIPITNEDIYNAIYNGEPLLPVNGNLPNGEYIIEINGFIYTINNNGIIDNIPLENDDRVCITPLTYDLAAINDILACVYVICQINCDLINTPNLKEVVDLFFLGGNDGTPGISGLREMLDFVDSLSVPDIQSVADAHTRLRAVNASIGQLCGYICYAGMTNKGLPIELESFTGLSNNCEVKLTWKTASERNFSHFEIQKSYNGIDFHKISRVESISNSDSDGGTYSYTDSKDIKPINYYRLKSVDKDHTFAYSDVVAVKSECADGNISPTVNVYPNPIKGNSLSVQLFAPFSTNNAKIYITDKLGRTITEQSVDMIEGFNQLEIDVERLNVDMMYFLHIQSAEWSTVTQRFVKSR